MSPLSPSHRPRGPRALAALTVLAVAGGALVAAGPATAATAPTTRTVTTTQTVVITPSDDAYTDSAVPKRVTGTATKLVASHGSGVTKTALLKFVVPPAPKGGVVAKAALAFTAERALPARVDLRALSSSAWSEQTVSHSSGIRPTTTLATAKPATGSKALAFDLSKLVLPGRTQSFGVTAPAGVAPLMSAEATTGRPQLTVTYTVTTTVLVPAPAPAPVAKTQVMIGMAAPVGQWDLRVAQSGGVDSRRVFDDLATPDFGIATAHSEAAAGRMAILSFKVPGNDWAGVAAGRYDVQLKALAQSLAAVKGKVFVTLHHEPTGDGLPSSYAAMMRRALPILGAPANVDAGPIVNGFWFSKTAMGYTDAEIAQWLPADVLKVSEVVAADTYQGGDASKPGEDAGVKIKGMSAWANRVGVTRLGIGEYNGVDARSITAAGDAVLADPRFVFAAIYNSDVHNRAGIDWTLTGDRLEAFKATVAKARAARSAG